MATVILTDTQTYLPSLLQRSAGEMKRGQRTHLKYWAVVEVVRAGTSLECREGHVAPGEWRDVAELVRAERLLLVLAGADEASVRLAVGFLARAAVVLVRDPRAVLARALVDDEALRAAGVELQTHVGDVKRLTWKIDQCITKTRHQELQCTELNKEKIYLLCSGHAGCWPNDGK